MPSPHDLAALYSRAHDQMRNIDGLQPQEAFDELLKYLFFKQVNEETGPTVPLERHIRDDGGVGVDVRRVAHAVRRLFRQYLEATNGWSTGLWRDRAFRLSDAALVAVHELLREVPFGTLPFDTRGAALREFATPDVRRGLGIYLTPDAVAEAAVSVVSPSVRDKVYDPACGSGTFLIETLKRWVATTAPRESLTVFGSDKSPRMLLIAELNLGHSARARFQRRPMDAFSPPEDRSAWPAPNSMDVIFTNPPFGVTIDCAAMRLSSLGTAKAGDGTLRTRQASEVLFVEQCLRWLRPGGRLAIVVPRSLVTNGTLAPAREAIGHVGYVQAVLALPPETFSTAGTQTTTFVLFFRKYKTADEGKEPVTIAAATVENVGYDATGRTRSGNQLAEAAENLRAAISTGRSNGLAGILPATPKAESLARLAILLARPGPSTARRSAATRPLGDFVALADTGRTPARSAYRDEGLFILKVGNLTGRGIDWQPRDRNFVADEETVRRAKAELLLMPKDLVLTSSAHSPKYIAKKVDIVPELPSYVGGKATFVGEVLRLRLKPGAIDPYLLLAYLRSEGAMLQLQRMIRGQTAHLLPRDVLEMPLPALLLDPPKPLMSLRRLLVTQAETALQLDDLVRRESQLHAEIFRGH